MEVVALQRGTGKTTHAIMVASAENENYYIVCANKQRAKQIEQMASDIGVTINPPLTIDELLSDRFRGMKPGTCFIDDADDILQQLISRITKGQLFVDGISVTVR